MLHGEQVESGRIVRYQMSYWLRVKGVDAGSVPLERDIATVGGYWNSGDGRVEEQHNF